MRKEELISQLKKPTKISSNQKLNHLRKKMDEQKPQTNNDGLKTIKTYMSDMADTVRANEISVIKVALAEQNKHEREDLYRKIEGSPTKKIFWLIGGIIFIVAAIYGFYFVMQERKIKNAPAPIVREESIISYDENVNISVIDGDNLVEKINAIKKEASLNKNGSIKYINLSQQVAEEKETLPVKNLFEKLGFTAPASLVRSLSDSYMIGTYTKKISDIPNDPNNNPKLFIIFQSDDYEYTYAGMLDWEKTMIVDMLPLFELETAENKIKLGERPWKDLIINNKDSRVMINENGNPILYYLFIDKNKLVITDSTNVIKEIISRLMIKNMKPL